ncbi:PREDICTED: multiple inositol polyphosphate phosphatase 1-like [Ceratosolen solmsi marchali]|uniref:Multiple inositol polyphosphate phosphatase 1 n=1 Tax=Ceratosolen solmsi marchali TaxID=326594 RepID=A0AAJ7DUI9_9HYME|nr:PREDICTED: multiple inositol polyphosphate phosphatase 1-like [Ceratosolen solmsi marchali]
MNLYILVQFSLGALLSQVTAREIDYCYTSDQDPYLLMGTKTAYQFVQGRSRFPPVSNCSPIQIWILSRHGTRYPGKKSIAPLLTLSRLRDQIIYNHENRGNGRLCNNDFQALKNWYPYPSLNETFANELTRQGEQDMRLLARRLQSEFPDILRADPQINNYQIYKFRSSNTSRTRKSMEAFMDGLFNSRNAVPKEYTPSNDSLLHADKNCPEWDKSYDTDHVNDESDKFILGTEYQNLIQNVSSRLGFSHNINNESIGLMYDMCRYEKAWEINRLSIWCSIFNKQELKILEYLEDLNHFYYTGPGREINKKLGCPLVKDMFEHFRNLESGHDENEPKGIFYFSHTVTLQNFMAALDIDKDSTPLLASNYHSVTRRHYRTSMHGAFGTNIVAVFYRCSDVHSPNKVMFYINEIPLLMDGCKVGLCDWEFLKERFGRTAEECNLNFCFNPNDASVFNTYGFAYIFIIIHAILRSLFYL